MASQMVSSARQNWGTVVDSVRNLALMAKAQINWGAQSPGLWKVTPFTSTKVIKETKIAVLNLTNCNNWSYTITFLCYQIPPITVTCHYVLLTHPYIKRRAAQLLSRGIYIYNITGEAVEKKRSGNRTYQRKTGASTPVERGHLIHATKHRLLYSYCLINFHSWTS